MSGVAQTGPILEAVDLVRHFPVRDRLSGRAGTAMVRAVDGVSFTLLRNETLAVVGESGSGKTTLGRMVVRLLEPTGGRILFDGQDITNLSDRALRPIRRRMQMIFQDPFSSLNPRMKVREILAEPLAIHGWARSRRSERVAELLATVGLDPTQAERYSHQFSGGQRQRIGIARALAAGPDLIVGDEPVSALDVSVRAQILNLIADIRRSLGLSLVMITHDLGVVRHIADRVLVLYLGRVVEIGDTRTIFQHPRHPYTRTLLAATPDPFHRRQGPREVISGEVPSPITPPTGCRFHPRCPMAQAICARDEPPLRALQGEQYAACHFAERVPPPPPTAADGATQTMQRRLAVLRRAGVGAAA